jgi:hypothetical protein
MARKSPFDWIIEKLEDEEKVESTNISSENLLNIVRTGGPNLSVTKTSLEIIKIEDIKAILSVQKADFILHTFKEPFIYGDVFDYLDSKQKVLGGFGDLLKIAGEDQNWPYLPSNVHFIVRGLEQHTKVRSVRRLDNKRYEISRHGLETVSIIALDDYDLGIESIRNAVDKFEKFDAVFKANPNGRITSNAIELADSREIKVFTWRELLGKLNVKWD